MVSSLGENTIRQMGAGEFPNLKSQIVTSSRGHLPVADLKCQFGASNRLLMSQIATSIFDPGGFMFQRRIVACLRALCSRAQRRERTAQARAAVVANRKEPGYGG